MSTSLTAALISFALTAAAVPLIIPLLHRLRMGQAERELGPESHLKKAGTPTMGGVAMILSVGAALVITDRFRTASLSLGYVIVFVYGLIGFLDDYIKVVQKGLMEKAGAKTDASLGIRASHKMVLQILAAAALAFYAREVTGTSILLPFTMSSFDLGWAYVPFVMFVLVAVTNAVNLTDGLDGLAAGSTLIVMIFFTSVSLFLGLSELALMPAAVMGACLGFLCYNFNPARIFMGDTGSMALGAALAVTAVFTRTELFIVTAGLLFVIETVSVIMQVGYFKLTHGKRIFRMAPIHHHFELCGWPETRVVTVFWIFTAVCVMLSMIMAHISF
ncbi:MAG: phospho-N-acetylmuramoyl-pentapeptide-transferase [Eubacteriaceae bacterium]|nr:phospho-N-acetylmuramoyl-pentapeptide-transferase [Eubacteriaceae bacterium]